MLRKITNERQHAQLFPSTFYTASDFGHFVLITGSVVSSTFLVDLAIIDRYSSLIFSLEASRLWQHSQRHYIAVRQGVENINERQLNIPTGHQGVDCTASTWEKNKQNNI